jgi:hypothetical protein
MNQKLTQTPTAAMNRNFAALQAKMKEAENAKVTNGIPEGGNAVSVGA